MVVDSDRSRLNFIDLSKEAVGAAYYSLPRISLVSIIWCLLSVTVVLAGPATAVVVATAASALNRDRFRFHQLWQQFKRYFWRSQLPVVPTLMLVDVAGWALIRFETTGRFVFALAGFLAIDALLVVSVVLLYYYPLLIDHDESAQKTARRSVEFAVTHLRPTFALWLFCASLITLLGFTVAGFVLVGPGLTATVLTLGTRYLSGRPLQ